MELDEFLEKDIIHFLEERKEKKAAAGVDREEDYGLYLTKDYIKEVANALEKDEISIAQKLFDELKIHYDSLPKGSLEEKKIYSMLEQIYSKINSYLQLKGNSESIRSFNDTLGQGFQGALSTKIHLTTTKMDKKLDNIDVKLTGFGRDMKDLKSTLLINTPKIQIVAPSSPKDSRDAPTIDRKDRDKRTFSVPKELEKKNVEYITVFEEHKPASSQEVNPSPLINIREQNSVQLDKQHDKQILRTPQTSHTLQTPHTAKEEPKRRMKLFKIPKKVATKKQERIIMNAPEKIQEKSTDKIPEKIISETTTETTIIEKNPVANDDFEIMKVKTENKKTPSIIPIKNDSVFVEKENDNLFDSPFQKPVVEKPVENVIFSSIQISSKTSSNAQSSTSSNASPSISSYSSPNTVSSDSSNNSSNMSLNSFEGLYSEALKELNLKNYEGASKLFMKVLEMKPAHKASIIRLKQCEEAMHYA